MGQFAKLSYEGVTATFFIMVLVTGAAGKSGRAVIEALVGRGAAVRALIRDESKSEMVLSAGASGFVVGDMGDSAVYREAMRGVSAVYFICPNVHPNELEFAKLAIEGAKTAGVSRFVYHSVLHPQVEAMPHHWLKMRVEEALFASRLSFTILQPAAYMQNVLANWSEIVDEGVYRVPYSAESRHSMVDLEDVAEAAATVLLDSGHEYAVYELAGPEALSQREVARIVAERIGRPVVVEEVPIEHWREQAVGNGIGSYQIEALTKMFAYYDKYGLVGNPRILGQLLKRPPTTFATFVEGL